MDNVTMIRLGAGVGYLLVCVPLYFLASIIARQKRNAAAIFWLNLLTGWTFLGWVGAFIWALTNDTPRRTSFKAVQYLQERDFVSLICDDNEETAINCFSVLSQNSQGA